MLCAGSKTIPFSRSVSSLHCPIFHDDCYHRPQRTRNPRRTGKLASATLLSTLSAVQGDLLALLTEKRKALAEGDLGQLQQINRREGELVTRLEVCHSQRQELLNAAAGQGLPSGSVRSLTASLPANQREVLEPTVEQASRQSRLLQHNSLTNWVLVQRTLIHLSQMIEIIATGGANGCDVWLSGSS